MTHSKLVTLSDDPESKQAMRWSIVRYTQYIRAMAGEPMSDARALVLGGAGGDIPTLSAVGVQHANIMACDLDAMHVRYIKEHYPSVACRKMDVFNLDVKRHGRFDFILLDFCGPATPERVTKACKLAKRLGNPGAILGLGFSYGRESKVHTALMQKVGGYAELDAAAQRERFVTGLVQKEPAFFGRYFSPSISGKSGTPMLYLAYPVDDVQWPRMDADIDSKFKFTDYGKHAVANDVTERLRLFDLSSKAQATGYQSAVTRARKKNAKAKFKPGVVVEHTDEAQFYQVLREEDAQRGPKKLCTRCRESKELSEFSRHGHNLQSACKKCVALWRPRYRAQDRKRKREYRAANPELLRAQARKRLEANPELVQRNARAKERYHRLCSDPEFLTLIRKQQRARRAAKKAEREDVRQ